MATLSGRQGPTVLVTRPQPQADDWVGRLRALGQAAEALPLLAVQALSPQDPGLQAAWAGLERCRLVMFVSPNAVAAFMAARPEGRGWPASVWAGATGPGTVAALRQAGLPAEVIVAPGADAAQFDAETLWQQRLSGQDWAGQAVLIVRAGEGRDWLADTLRAQGAQVAPLMAYRRVAPVWSAAQVECLRGVARDPGAWAWSFSSSEAVRALPQLLTDHGLDAAALLGALRRVPAWATHPRIAETVRQAGFERVREVSPDPAALVAALADLTPGD